MSIWQTVTWDLARAGGLTAFGLLTLSVVIGLALSLRWQSWRWPRIINSELHNFLTLLALIFTGIHILAVWVDPFTHFGWNEILLPFASHYRPVWMAFGIVAFYLGLAIGLSTWLRSRIGYTWWRRFHTLTLLLFGLVVMHGLATGSDTQTWWAVAIYAGSVLLVGTLLWMRLRKPLSARSRAHPVLAGALVVLILLGTAGSLLGPLKPGWAKLANGITGKALSTPPLASRPSPTFPQSFTGKLQGQYLQQGPDAHGAVTFHLTMHLSNGLGGAVLMMFQGQTRRGDEERSFVLTASQVALLSGAGQPLFTGALNTLSGERHLSLTATLVGSGTMSGSSIYLQMTIWLAPDGQVTGTIAAGNLVPGGGGPSSEEASGE